MRLLICVPLLLAACSAGSNDRQSDSTIRITGKLENAKLDEASGLARSIRNPEILWIVNDSGPARLYAIDATGKERARVQIEGAKNKDWEDLASFVLDDEPYLLLADIGDNESKRKDVRLYFVEEPTLDHDAAEIAWQFDFEFPDGPRDAESIAVDVKEQKVYVLSKRTIPAVLYSVPLVAIGDKTVVATRLMALDGLPQPSRQERRYATGSGQHWQPTSMDFSADGRTALFLTYSGVYFYAREEQQTWTEAFANRALGIKLGKIKNAEAIAFEAGGESALLAVEKKHAPLYRVNLQSAISQSK